MCWWNKHACAARIPHNVVTEPQPYRMVVTPITAPVFIHSGVFASEVSMNVPAGL